MTLAWIMLFAVFGSVLCSKEETKNYSFNFMPFKNIYLNTKVYYLGHKNS